MLGTMPILYIMLNLYGSYLRNLSKKNKQLDGYAGGVAGEVSVYNFSFAECIFNII